MPTTTAHEITAAEIAAADILLKIRSDDPAESVAGLKEAFARPDLHTEILTVAGATPADLD